MWSTLGRGSPRVTPM